MPLQFFSEETSFELDNPAFYSSWLETIITTNNKSLGNLNYIFCSDDYLLAVNQEHLQHDYYTDIITFNHSEDDKLIEADVYVSVDRIKENATTFKSSFHHELSRVMAHGLLHLLGYNDKTDAEKKLMREKEDTCISLQKK